LSDPLSDAACGADDQRHPIFEPAAHASLCLMLEIENRCNSKSSLTRKTVPVNPVRVLCARTLTKTCQLCELKGEAHRRSAGKRAGAASFTLAASFYFG
jgi:hypothetical protein